MTNIINGREISKSIKENIKKNIGLFDIPPRLDIILVEGDKSSDVYVKIAQKSCAETGIEYVTHILPIETAEEELIDLIYSLNEDKNVSAILCQMPLPKKINEKNIALAISPKKDVDCISPINFGRLAMGDKYIAPCTPKGVMRLIEYTGSALEGANAVVVGRSNIVGKPLFHLLLEKSATVTMVHSRTRNIETICNNADILCVSIGKPEFINKNFIKKDAVVIDIGINVLKDGSIKGDVLFEDVLELASFITPVPNGVGPMTIAMLLENTIYLHKNNILNS